MSTEWSNEQMESKCTKRSPPVPDDLSKPELEAVLHGSSLFEASGRQGLIDRPRPGGLTPRPEDDWSGGFRHRKDVQRFDLVHYFDQNNITSVFIGLMACH